MIDWIIRLCCTLEYQLGTDTWSTGERVSAAMALCLWGVLITSLIIWLADRCKRRWQ